MDAERVRVNIATLSVRNSVVIALTLVLGRLVVSRQADAGPNYPHVGACSIRMFSQVAETVAEGLMRAMLFLLVGECVRDIHWQWHTTKV